MSDEKIDHAALIAEARMVPLRPYEDNTVDLARRLADALEAAQPQGEYHEGLEEGIKIGRAEAAQQAPAVDREALAQTIYKATTGTWAWADDQAKSDFREVASDVIASGILLDSAVLAREVEARGLEKAAEAAFRVTANMHGGFSNWLNRRAQQVREGN